MIENIGSKRMLLARENGVCAIFNFLLTLLQLNYNYSTTYFGGSFVLIWVFEFERDTAKRGEGKNCGNKDS